MYVKEIQLKLHVLYMYTHSIKSYMNVDMYSIIYCLKVGVQFNTEPSQLPSRTLIKTKHISQQVGKELMEILREGGGWEGGRKGGREGGRREGGEKILMDGRTCTCTYAVFSLRKEKAVLRVYLCLRLLVMYMDMRAGGRDRI